VGDSRCNALYDVNWSQINREAVTSSSPTLPRCGYVGFLVKTQFNREAVASIPDVAFVPINLVTPEQLSQLILKIHFVMVFMLIGNVLPDSFKIRGADRGARLLFATLVASLEALPQPLQGCPNRHSSLPNVAFGNVGLEDETASRFFFMWKF